MQSTVTAPDRRMADGLRIAATAGQWTQAAYFYAIPSQSNPAVTYLSDGFRCTCPDFERRQRPCKHCYAVRIFAEEVTHPYVNFEQELVDGSFWRRFEDAA